MSTLIRDFLHALVHPSVRDDPAAAERHVAFMASRLCGSLLALGAFPVFLAWHGVPSALEFVVLAWMIVPIATACFLSRTGRYEAAQALSAFALTCIVTIVAAASGGMDSFAAIWLVLIPLEAALSGSRRAVLVAASLAFCGVGLLAVAGSWFGLPTGIGYSSRLLVTLGAMSVLAYATGIALGADGLVQAMRPGREEQRQLPAFGSTDAVTWHSHGGRIVDASANAPTVLGAPASDLHGYGLFDRIHIADRPAYLRTLSEAAASGDPGETEFRLRRPGEAGFIWIEMRCRAFNGNSDRDGMRADVVAVMRDVTARKNHQDALIAARAEAERANAAKSRFLASMSHELLTPLNAIIGFSDMLQNEMGHPADGARRREYARIISQSGHHLLAVANDILDMSRLEAGHFEHFPEPFQPGAVIASSVELLALRAEEAGVALEADVPDDLPEMVADRRAIMQVLINLIANAIKFSHRGGTVTVSAASDGKHVALKVADDGIGMAPNDLARIGSPYFRGAGGRRHEGSGTGLGAGPRAGLGLSIVKGLVDLHGGALDAESRPGNGTRMTVRLPVDCEKAVLVARVQKRA
jgi:two-component system, cell cycle sensor histidine kinase DivJ